MYGIYLMSAKASPMLAIVILPFLISTGAKIPGCGKKQLQNILHYARKARDGKQRLLQLSGHA